MSRYIVIQDGKCWNILDTQATASDAPDKQNSIKMMTVYDHADVAKVLAWLNDTSAISLIAEERKRQVEQGFTPEHDDTLVKGEMTHEALYYMIAGEFLIEHPDQDGTQLSVPTNWRASPDAWKPGKDAIANLVVAAGLLAADIDRLLRAKSAAVTNN